MTRFEEYPNTLTSVALSSKAVEDRLKSMALTFSPIRRNDVEWEMRLPSFIDSFYSILISSQVVPTQEEFYRGYLLHNSEWFDKSALSEEQLEGIKARAFRAYPSLVRDFHFGKLLQETHVFDSVWHNPLIDSQQGIDLVVTYKTKDFAVNLYTDTSRAKIGREKKKNRHEALDITSIEFPLKFEDNKKVGDLYLYQESDAMELYKTIKQLTSLEV